MNRTLLGFLGGAAVAAGIAWFVTARRDQPRAEPVPVVETAQAPLTKQEQPAEQPAPVVPKPSPVAARKAAPKTIPSVPAPAEPVNEVKSAPVPETPPAEQKREEVPPPPLPQQAPKEPPKPRTVTLAEGSLLSVRVNEALSTAKNKAGDTFSASLEQPLVVDGLVVAEKGAWVQGRVVEVVESGKVKGLAQLKIELVQFEMSDRQRVKIETASFERAAEASTKSDATKVAIGAGIGAAIGAIAGGGKGAAIGAGAGGAAGAGSVLLTRGKPAEIASETRITFRLAKPVALTEKLR